MGDRSRIELRDSTDLLGRSCAVRAQAAIGTDRLKRWWVTIIDVTNGRFVKVRGAKAFEKPRWVELKDCMWKRKRERMAVDAWLMREIAIRPKC